MGSYAGNAMSETHPTIDLETVTVRDWTADDQDAVRWLFQHVGGGGGWMLSSSNSIDSGADPENVRAMGRAMRALSYGPE